MWKWFRLVLLGMIIFQTNIALAVNSSLADSPWPVFHGDSKLTGQSKYDTSKIKGGTKWQFRTEGQVETSPVIDKDGNIYISDQKCNLYAIDPDGKERWKFDAGEPVSSTEWGGSSCFQSSPSLATDGTIYIAPMTGYLFAVTKDGKEKWKYPVYNFKNNWTSPAVGKDGTIYVGSEAYPPSETGKPQEKPAYIYALNPDGTLKWEYNTGGNWSTSTASIADDGTIYMSGNDCKQNCVNVLFALDGQTGDVKWTFESGGVLESSASIGADGTIYFGVKGGNNPREGAKFFALTPDGKEKWSLDIPCGNSITPAISTDGSIYFGDWDGVFYKISPEGKIIWKVDTPKTFETLSSSPAIGADGTIYFGSTANYFYAYTPEGKEKWKYRIADSGTNSSPAIGKDGTIYVGLTSGYLVAFGNGKVNSQTQTTQSSNSIVYAISSALALLAIALIVIFIRRKFTGYRCLLYLIPIILIIAAAILTFGKNDKNEPSNKAPIENTLDKMFDYGEEFEKICPDKIVMPEKDKYTAISKDKTWDIPNMRQIDWISESCPDTIWPDDK